MNRKYSFKKLIILSTLTIFIVFSIIIFVIFNNIYFQNFRTRYISENFFAANTTINILNEEKENMLLSARQIANDEIVYRAFENRIYIGTNWNVKDGMVLNKFPAMDKFNYKQIVNIEKRKIYGIAGGTINYGVALYGVDKNKIKFIDASLEFDKNFIDNGNEKYLLDVAGKNNYDSTETAIFQEKDNVICIKANVPIGKNVRFYDGRPKGIVQVFKTLDSFFIDKIKNIINRDIVIIKDNKIIMSTIFEDITRIKDAEVMYGKVVFKDEKFQFGEIYFKNKKFAGTFFNIEAVNINNEKIKVGVVYDIDIINNLFNKTLKKYILIEILFLFIFLIVIFILLKYLLMPVEKIVQALKKVAVGDYSLTIEESKMKEFDYIISNINYLTDAVKRRENELKVLNMSLEEKVKERTLELDMKNHLLEKQKEKAENELLMAKKVHEKIIKFNLPDLKNYNVYIDNKSVKGIGGDFIDCIELKDGRKGFVFVDIAGHGLAASLIISAIKLVVNTNFREIYSPSEALYFLNELINDTFIEGITVSMVYLIIDDDKEEIIISCGAQEEVLIIKDEIACLDEKGIILGAVSNDVIKSNEKIAYKDIVLKLKKGEKIFIYTDGLIENQDLDREKLFEIIEKLKYKNGIEIMKTINNIIYNTVLKDERDDITYMLIEKK